MPPPETHVPAPPAGFVAPAPAGGGTVTPRQLEVAPLSHALEELESFHDYAETLGKTATPYAQLVQILDAACQWTTMRNATATWGDDSFAQETLAWRTLRTQRERVKPAFDLAVSGDPTIATKYSKRASLLGAQAEIAKKGLATRALDKKAVAEGKAPTHGKIGKQRQRAAEKQAFAHASVAPVTAPVVAAVVVPGVSTAPPTGQTASVGVVRRAPPAHPSNG